MSLTEKIAVKIGSNARLLSGFDDDKEQIIIYGAINLIQIISAVLWVVIVGLVFGVLYEALIFSITVSILRKYSGGVHASSPSRCIIIGTTVAILIGLGIDKMFCKFSVTSVILISILFILFAFIVVIRNAPVDSIKKPITNIEMKKNFKKKSIIIVAVFSIIIIILYELNKEYSELFYIKIIESISLGVLWQVITLTKSGIRILNKVDFVLKYMIGKE